MPQILLPKESFFKNSLSIGVASTKWQNPKWPVILCQNDTRKGFPGSSQRMCMLLCHQKDQIINALYHWNDQWERNGQTQEQQQKKTHVEKLSRWYVWHQHAILWRACSLTMSKIAFLPYWFPNINWWTGNSTSRFLLHLSSRWIQLSRKLFPQNCISWSKGVIDFHSLYCYSFCLRAMTCFHDMCTCAQLIVQKTAGSLLATSGSFILSITKMLLHNLTCFFPGIRYF